MDKGCFINRSAAESTTFKVIIERYIADVCPTMRGGADESIRLRATCRTKLAKLNTASLTPKAIADYRDGRVFPIEPAAHHAAFKHACRRAGLVDLH